MTTARVRLCGSARAQVVSDAFGDGDVRVEHGLRRDDPVVVSWVGDRHAHRAEVDPGQVVLLERNGSVLEITHYAAPVVFTKERGDDGRPLASLGRRRFFRVRGPSPHARPRAGRHQRLDPVAAPAQRTAGRRRARRSSPRGSGSTTPSTAGGSGRSTTAWGRVTVSWWTPKLRGLHRGDPNLAAKADRLASANHPSPPRAALPPGPRRAGAASPWPAARPGRAPGTGSCGGDLDAAAGGPRRGGSGGARWESGAGWSAGRSAGRSARR